MEKSDKGAAGAASLDTTNFQLLRIYFQNAFIKYFESIPGKKSVFFDQGLLKVLSFVIGTPPLSAKIEETLLLTSSHPLDIKNDSVVFIIRPELQSVRDVIYQRKQWQSDKEFYILFVPRRTIECDEELENEKLFVEDKISQIAMDLVPLEDDLLSLELADNFAHYALQDDDSYKVYIQNSINRIETVFGPIKYKYGKGDDSCQILSRIRDSQVTSEGGSGVDSEIDCLIMIDRNVDLISPFCVNQTYEGLLDENFGIKTCTISVDQSIVKPETAKDAAKQQTQPGPFMILLTSEDVIYKEIRDKHFTTLENVFKKKCQEIQDIVKEKDAPQSIDELGAYIQKLKSMNIAKGKDMLAHHINLAFYINNQMKSLDYSHCYGLEQKIILGEEIKSIMNTLEIKMAKQYDKNKILRLLCLLSVTQSGLKQADFDTLRKAYIMNYGFQEVITLMNLQDAKLFRPKDKRLDWTKLKKSFKLINEETRIADPIDISYVYNGYSPLSVKFIETMMITQGLKATDERIKMLPGAYMAPQNEHEFFLQARGGGMDQQKKKKILIYYVGGITYGEIAAIRFLNKLFKDKKFIIATTQIINGETCIDMLRGNVTNNLDLAAPAKK